MAFDESQQQKLIELAGGPSNVGTVTALDNAYVISLKDQGMAQPAEISKLGFVRKATLKAGVLRVTPSNAKGQDMAGKYHELAGEILSNVGGIENVNGLAHCITRLRFNLKDEGKANKEALEALDGVIQIMQSGGQYQVVVGSKVDDVYEELVSEYKVPGMGGAPADDAPAETEKSKNPFFRLMDIISGSMGPILMPLAAAGMIKGLIAMAQALGWVDATSGAYLIWYAIGDGFFYFLPIILGYTAAKKFGCSEFTGMALGAALVYPSMVNLAAGDPAGTIFTGTAFQMRYYADFFGIPVVFPSAGYTSSVIPIILAVWVASKLERALKVKLPELIRTFATPVIVFAVMAPLTYLLIGPLAGLISSVLTLIATGIYGIPAIGSALMGLIVGGAWSTLVMFGLHWAFVPIIMNNLATLGYDPVGAVTLLGGFVGVGQGIAVILRTKSNKTRGIALPATISQLCGIGEPLLYGIQVPTKFLLVQNIALAAIGGLAMGILNVHQYMMGGMGLFVFPSYINPATGDARDMLVCIAVVVVEIIAGFVLTMATYHDDGCYLGKNKKAEAAE